MLAPDRGNVKVPKIVVKDHWATATYIIVIWGPNLMHILEASVVGMALKRTSTRRRICYVSDVPRQTQLLLNTVWEIRQYAHLDLSSMRRTGASKRLSKVYPKLLAWSWLAGEAEVVIMLDTDLYIQHSLDNAFYKVTHCNIAGAFRGRGDFRLDSPRPPSSIKTKENKDRGRHGGGGINGGVVVFRPNKQEADDMLRGLQTYIPPDGSGGEQDYISQHLGLQQQIGQMDISMNFQVHQLALTGAHDSDEGRWVSLAERPAETDCLHFSALPTPSNILLGNVDEESCGWMWESFKEHAEWCNDDCIPPGDRGEWMAKQIYNHNAQKSFLGTASAYRHKLFTTLAVDVTRGYLSDWFDDSWPNLFEMVYSNLMLQARVSDGEGEICRYCGNPWNVIGCPQHVLFACPKIQHVAFKSWQQFGPGTPTNICVPASLWVDIVRQIGANPFQVKTGVSIQIKIVNLGCLIEAFEDTELIAAFQSNRHSQPLTSRGKDVMNEYKYLCRKHYHGDMAIAMDRTRGCKTQRK